MKEMSKRMQGWKRRVSALCAAAMVLFCVPLQNLGVEARAAVPTAGAHTNATPRAAVATDTTIATDTTDVTASGTCGDNLTWTLEGGVLTIAGEGEMTDYVDTYRQSDEAHISSAPWGAMRTRSQAFNSTGL